VRFVLQFFRDPPRTPASADANAVISPADGRIVVVGQATDPFRNVPALKISVFMNVFNAHSQRSPFNGTVEEVRYFPGAFVNAALPKASTENERNAVLMKLDSGAAVTVVQIAGLIARRILCYVQPGQHLSVGERYGFIRFGSRLDVYLPPQSQAAVTLGDKVYAGQTVLARL
jgi:phosphatidylserine decarboxylase